MQVSRCAASIHDLVASLDKIKNKNYFTHNIHPYPAKFIPQIPACLIEAYSQNSDVILDPFCGSGTTLLEAILRGRKSIGLDLNPIATLISRVKVTPLNDSESHNILSFLHKLDQSLINIHMRPNWLRSFLEEDDFPDFYNRHHWFQPNVQSELALIKRLIREHRCSDRIRDFLTLCLSAIIVRVSNQESNTRWVAVKKNITDGFTVAHYRSTLTTNLDKVVELRERLPAKVETPLVVTAGVSEINAHIDQPKVDLVVTSPPYLNSYDYYLYHKLRMFWLGYNHKTVQKHEIGSRHKHCDKQQSITTFVNSMRLALDEIFRLLKATGTCCFVVGDAIYRGDLVRMDCLYEDILLHSGFKLIDKASFDQRKYTRSFTPNLKKLQKKSYILIFRRQQCPS